jgi:hypothetical protein
VSTSDTRSVDCKKSFWSNFGELLKWNIPQDPTKNMVWIGGGAENIQRDVLDGFDQVLTRGGDALKTQKVCRRPDLTQKSVLWVNRP